MQSLLHLNILSVSPAVRVVSLQVEVVESVFFVICCLTKYTDLLWVACPISLFFVLFE